MIMTGKFLVFFGLFCLSAAECFAIQIEALDTTRTWLLAGVDFTGNEKFGRSELAAPLLTQPRPWYRFWSSLPVFDSLTFREDLERLRRLYEAHGFYQECPRSASTTWRSIRSELA